MRRAWGWSLAALLLGGCVYYNGMYNAKRLAGSAWKAERDGRAFEANNLWGQVITRAETLLVRHPDSKYVDEALVLKGIALSRLRQCPEAVTPLGRASVVELEDRTGEEAALALGRCHLELGDPVAADLAFSRVLESGNAARRREARLQRAHALRLLGRHDEALKGLEDLRGPRASEQRLLALGAAGREAEAKALGDTLLAQKDTTRVWDSVFAIIGRSNPRTASAMVDHLGPRLKATPDARARRLIQDAERLETVDSTRALARLHQAADIRDGGDAMTRARLRLARRELQRAEAPAALTALGERMADLAGADSPTAQEARLLQQTILGVKAAADSSGPDRPEGDLRLFLAAETARDTLLAPRLATSLFRQLVETWPDSPYAPKAVLAGRVLDPDWGEAVRPLLDERYAGSPYLAFVRGEDPGGYRELEDSLRTYTARSAAAARQPPSRAAPGPGRPGVGRPQGPQRTPRREPAP